MISSSGMLESLGDKVHTHIHAFIRVSFHSSTEPHPLLHTRMHVHVYLQVQSDDHLKFIFGQLPGRQTKAYKVLYLLCLHVDICMYWYTFVCTLCLTRVCTYDGEVRWEGRIVLASFSRSQRSHPPRTHTLLPIHNPTTGPAARPVLPQPPRAPPREPPA